jgi:hypothetical protein
VLNMSVQLPWLAIIRSCSGTCRQIVAALGLLTHGDSRTHRIGTACLQDVATEAGAIAAIAAAAAAAGDEPNDARPRGAAGAAGAAGLGAQVCHCIWWGCLPALLPCHVDALSPALQSTCMARNAVVCGC